MATRNVDATRDPVSVTAAPLSLAAGTGYSLQNVDSSARLYFREAAVKPVGAARRGFVLQPLDTVEITPEAVAPHWLWTDEDGCRCVITEA